MKFATREIYIMVMARGPWLDWRVVKQYDSVVVFEGPDEWFAVDFENDHILSEPDYHFDREPGSRTFGRLIEGAI